MILVKKGALAALIALLGLMLPMAASATSSTWTAMSAPDSGSVDLISVACPKLSFCVAPGVYPGEDVILDWNGTQWSFEGAYQYAFNAVSCASPTFCVAVGYNFDPYPRSSTAVALVYTGGSGFSLMNVVNPSTRWNGFTGIKCLSPTNCEATGYQSRYEGPSGHPLFESWNGRTGPSSLPGTCPRGLWYRQLSPAASASNCRGSRRTAAPGAGTGPSGRISRDPPAALAGTLQYRATATGVLRSGSPITTRLPNRGTAANGRCNPR